MDSKITLNLNHKVKVFLTEIGQSTFLKHPIANRFSCYNASGVLELTLWELMSIFGPKMKMGFESEFTNNEIHYLGDIWQDNYKAAVAKAEKLEFERSG